MKMLLVISVMALVVTASSSLAHSAPKKAKTEGLAAAKESVKETAKDATKEAKEAKDIKDAQAKEATKEELRQDYTPEPVLESQPEIKAELPVGGSKLSEGGLLGPVTLGPSVAVAVPHPINLGIEGRFTDYLGFGIVYGFLPELSILDAKVKMKAFDFRARVFPFGGAFFIGTSIGKQSITASGSVTQTVATQSVTNTIGLDVGTVYFQPTIGWRWGGKKGFIFGMDFGYQMSLSNSSTLTTSSSNPALDTQAAATAEYQKQKKDIEEAGDKLGKTGLPAFTAIHIGYLF